jgi:hypothetical protein
LQKARKTYTLRMRFADLVGLEMAVLLLRKVWIFGAVCGGPGNAIDVAGLF